MRVSQVRLRDILAIWWIQHDSDPDIARFDRQAAAAELGWQYSILELQDYSRRTQWLRRLGDRGLTHYAVCAYLVLLARACRHRTRWLSLAAVLSATVCAAAIVARHAYPIIVRSPQPAHPLQCVNDYVYIEELDWATLSQAQKPIVVAYEKASWPEGRRVVGFLDGHVEWMDEEVLVTLLAGQGLEMHRGAP